MKKRPKNINNLKQIIKSIVDILIGFYIIRLVFMLP